MSKDTLSRLQKTETLLIKARNLAKAANLVKSTAQYKQMLGDVNQHKEAFDTAKKMPNSNWGTWVINNYKKDPEAFKKNKSAIEHYSGMTHLAEVRGVRMEPHHSFDDGLKMLERAESSGVNRLGSTLVPAEGVRLTEPRNGYAWYDLGRGSCEKEGKAMGHCGNKPTVKTGDRLLSLRRVVKTGDGKDMHEPAATFVENNGWLGEMKGRANSKPSAKYHENIMDLLQHDRIKQVAGGGLDPHKNFAIQDLSDANKAKLKEKKPDLDVFNLDSEEKEKALKIPQKHEEDVKKLLDYRRVAKVRGEASGRGLEGQVLHEVKSAAYRAPEMALNLVPSIEKKDISEILLSNAESHHKQHALTLTKDPEHISMALNDKKPIIRATAARHPNATAEHLNIALKDEDDYVRAAAASHPNATAEHLNIALKDEDHLVRAAAAMNPNATAEHLSTALGDKDRKYDIVREAAARHPKATAEHLSAALGDVSPHVRIAAAEHKNATAEHLSTALKDEDYNVRAAAAGNDNATAEHRSIASKDNHPHVRTIVAAYEEWQLDPKIHNQGPRAD